MKFHLLLFLALFLFPFSAGGASNDLSTPSSDDKTATTAPSPTPESTNRATNTTNHSSGAAKALVIHKPMPSPSWGRVIQYHREENFVLSDKNREILHEFLFQDDNGIVRTAIFHENTSGDGYWEVLVWDQP